MYFAYTTLLFINTNSLSFVIPERSAGSFFSYAESMARSRGACPERSRRKPGDAYISMPYETSSGYILVEHPILNGDVKILGVPSASPQDRLFAFTLRSFAEEKSLRRAAQDERAIKIYS